MKKFIIGAFLLLPLPLLAAYVPLEPLPFVPSGSPSFPALLSGAFTLAIIIGSAIAVLMITLGGIQYMTSEVLHEKEAGKERIKNAVLGLLLLLSIYLILSAINPQLLNFNLNVPPVGSSSGRSNTTAGAVQLPDRVGAPTTQQIQSLYESGNPNDNIVLGKDLANIPRGFKNQNTADFTKGCTQLGGTTYRIQDSYGRTDTLTCRKN